MLTYQTKYVSKRKQCPKKKKKANNIKTKGKFSKHKVAISKQEKFRKNYIKEQEN